MNGRKGHEFTATATRLSLLFLAYEVRKYTATETHEIMSYILDTGMVHCSHSWVHVVLESAEQSVDDSVFV